MVGFDPSNPLGKVKKLEHTIPDNRLNLFPDDKKYSTSYETFTLLPSETSEEEKQFLKKVGFRVEIPIFLNISQNHKGLSLKKWMNKLQNENVELFNQLIEISKFISFKGQTDSHLNKKEVVENLRTPYFLFDRTNVRSITDTFLINRDSPKTPHPIHEDEKTYPLKKMNKLKKLVPYPGIYKKNYSTVKDRTPPLISESELYFDTPGSDAYASEPALSDFQDISTTSGICTLMKITKQRYLISID